MRFALTYRKCRTSVLRCQQGLATLEFALIVPVFMLVVMGIIEFSMIMFTTAVMESATNNTARLGKTGFTVTGTSRDDEIKNNIKARTAGLLDPNKIVFSTEVYADLSKIGQPEPCIKPPTAPCDGTPGINFVDINGNGKWDKDMGKAGLGNPGDIVVYTASYDWPILTPMVSAIIGKTFTISARTVVRNEPYAY